MTPCYTAPELFSEDSFSFKSDFWAIGCIFFELASGQVPFFDESLEKLISNIIDENIDFSRISSFSSEFNDLIRRLLEKNPYKRISWQDLVVHPFWDLPFGENIKVKDPFFEEGKTKDKEKVDVVRLSRTALKNKEEDQNYSNEQEVEVQGPDSEFKFNDNQQVDMAANNEAAEYEQVKEHKPFDKMQGSILNVSRIIKSDKRNVLAESKMNKLVVSQVFQVKSFEEVMVHQSDKNVRPIIGNKLIEVISAPTYNAKKIGITELPKPSEVKEIFKFANDNDINVCFQKIFSAFEKLRKGSNQEKLFEFCCYLESFMNDKYVANSVINTGMPESFLEILRETKFGDDTKVRVVSILGFLVRFSTMINSPLDSMGFSQILISTLKSSNKELARRSASTLGEYMFFVATQAESDNSEEIWRLEDKTIDAVLSVIETSADEIQIFYFIKTIENIVSVTEIAKNKIAVDRTVKAICPIFLSSKNAELVNSCSFVLAHLIKLNPALLETLLQVIPLARIQSLIKDEGTRVKQNLVNCLLLGCKANLKSLLNSEDKEQLALFLIEVLKSSSQTVSIKIILLFALLLSDTYILTRCGEAVFKQIMKIRMEQNSDQTEENETYVSIKVFEDFLKQKIIQLTKSFNQESQNQKDYEKQISKYLEVFRVVSSYNKLTTWLFSQELLEKLIFIVSESEIRKSEQIQKSIFEILSLFSDNQQFIVENYKFVSNSILLQILDLTSNDFVENKGQCLLIGANILSVILNDDK